MDDPQQTPPTPPPPQVVVIQQKRGVPGWVVLLIVLGVVFLLVVPCGFLGLGILLPALGKARESAQELKAKTQVRAITQGLAIYAQSYDDALPPADAWQDLLTSDGFVPAELFTSPLGDGVNDYIYVPAAEFTFEMDRVLVYEDPAHLRSGDVIAGFHDGHAEQMTRERFDALLESSEAATEAGAAEEGP
ncbi:MAG: hypothetical protein DHS20C14_22180 [Phycisphaeraceae bacterium]|nr:MAG: hypothetical protein DHS20C14_22180 [Phycisphaeraceae bacterium]